MLTTSFEVKTGTPVCQSAIDEYPVRGMVILKMELMHSRLMLDTIPAKLCDLPMLKTSKVGITAPIDYTIVAAWSDDIPFELGTKVRLDESGFVTDYNSELTHKLFEKVITEFRVKETEIRKEGGDVNKLLPKDIKLTTYVLTEAFNIKASKLQDVEDLFNKIVNL